MGGGEGSHFWGRVEGDAQVGWSLNRATDRRHVGFGFCGGHAGGGQWGGPIWWYSEGWDGGGCGWLELAIGRGQTMWRV